MCLTVPGRIVRVEESEATGRVARVDFGVAVRTASLLYVPEATVGDFVIVQAGFATRRLGAREAEEAIAARRELDALGAGSAPRAGVPVLGR